MVPLNSEQMNYTLITRTLRAFLDKGFPILPHWIMVNNMDSNIELFPSTNSGDIIVDAHYLLTHNI